MNKQLFNVDCNIKIDQFLKQNRKFDLILTDPPYELEIHGGTANNDFSSRKLISDKHIEFISNGFDYDVLFDKLLRLQNIPNMLIFCSNKQISKIMSYFQNRNLSTTLLVWQKKNPIPLCYGKYVSDLQFIVWIRGKGSFFNNNEQYKYKLKCKHYTSPSSKYRIHPTEKPIKLLQELIRIHSKENDVIFDPFFGSGSTCIASLNLNRNFVGCEIDNQFFIDAKKKIDNLIVQPSLFQV